MDYFLQSIFNCCLLNIKDIFENGTVMNGKLIETPKSFRVACTVLSQVVAAVASAQYGFIKENACRTKTMLTRNGVMPNGIG